MESSADSPLLVIACGKPIPIGSTFVVITNGETLGEFEVVDVIRGGYLAKANKITSPIGWGFLCSKMDDHVRPRIDRTVAILLHAANGGI